MAVSTSATAPYRNRYNSDTFSAAVDDLAAKLPDLLGRNNSKIANEYNNHITELIAQQDRLLKLLNIDSTGDEGMRELNDRIKVYESAMVNFHGKNLKETLLSEYMKGTEGIGIKLSKAIEVVLPTLVDLVMKQATNNFNKNFHATAMDILNDGRGNNSNGSSSIGLFKSKKGFKGGTNFNPLEFTSEQKDQWKRIIESAKDPNSKYGKILANIPEVTNYLDELKSKNNKLTMEWVLQVNGNYEFATKERLEAIYPNEADRNKKINDINSALKTKILQYVKNPSDGKPITNADLVSMLFDTIIQEDKYAFIVGNNENGMTGILGELAAMFYFYRLTGGTPAPTWTGGVISNSNSKKPHRDLILSDYGIQIKNTTQAKLGEVSFADASLYQILKNLENQVSDDTRNLIANYFGMMQFNVPYHRNDAKQAVPGLINYEDNGMQEKTELYKVNRDTLGNLLPQIKVLITSLADIFMYMNAYQGIASQDRNTLFVLGSSLILSSAQILKEIYANFEAPDSNAFQVKIKYPESDENYNIISVLNRNFERSFHKNALGDDNKLSRSDTVLYKISLTSSFNFSTMYPKTP